MNLVNGAFFGSLNIFRILLSKSKLFILIRNNAERTGTPEPRKFVPSAYDPVTINATCGDQKRAHY
jgi:hypothetical protein